jgi:hypothetical protein
LILLIVFSLILIPLLPGEETNPVILNEIRIYTKSYCPSALIQTSDEGFALAGEVSLFGPGGPAIGKPYVTDMWLMKTDSNGVPQWNQSYGGAECERTSALIQTMDGGFALAGQTYSYSASLDMLLVKTDANGNSQWNRNYGATGLDKASSLIQTTDGGFALAGAYNRVHTDEYDMWLVKTDGNGVAQWSQRYGEIDWITEEDATSLIQTTDEGFALASSIKSFGADNDNDDNSDIWLVKTDVNGVTQWNKTYGGAYRDGTTALVQTVDGGLALVGYTLYGEGGLYYAFSDMWLIKTDMKGVVQWNQTYGGLGVGRNFDLVQTPDGGFAVTHSGMQLLKTDEDGVPQWNQTYGGAEGGWNTHMIQTKDGGYAITASTQSFATRTVNVTLVGGDVFSQPETNMLLLKTDANGVVQWIQLYDIENLKARTIVSQNTSGLRTPSLLIVIVVFIIARRLINEKKK